MTSQRKPLSKELPPLIFGCGTFNISYNDDPYALPAAAIVHHAMSSGIRAFDTSPYYGPSEEILGQALTTDYVEKDFPRHTYQLLTKIGRIGDSSFDYSPAWVRYSVKRSLKRLRTTYLDVVYCHDVEFVTPQEVLEAVRELRRIRDTDQTIKYVGISGYPVDELCSLAELILKETGEPLDVVMSYANYNLQNTRLLTRGLERLRAAGVDVVPNASILGMGLLRKQGVFLGPRGDWHPAPDGLRAATHKASDWLTGKNERLEAVATRYGLESWMQKGSSVGAFGHPLETLDPSKARLSTGQQQLGVNVMGMSSVQEVDDLVKIYREVLDDVLVGNEPSPRSAEIAELAVGVRSILGAEWTDYAWPSPGEGYVNTLPEEHRKLLREQGQDTSHIKTGDVSVGTAEVGNGVA
ncbi:hypothetical protein UA08_07655 [Talaromyces atroroseus]|uniref:NADP-dependent oxidoreductase domain-containing protein n=1 Tax=Talaromyces atroroseus TaxID=1441469 RepID=A0A225AR43_TALAT|nr:hypothetical protein UA08_07655 [Talaromyces atroroseus]OKL57406.1 hypothetical protein UA08_07655 [Talaromyces atroroseus]